MMLSLLAWLWIAVMAARLVDWAVYGVSQRRIFLECPRCQFVIEMFSNEVFVCGICEASDRAIERVFLYVPCAGPRRELDGRDAVS